MEFFMKTCKTCRRPFAAQGFTLIEMAVVLIIIGLILGAVSIGKDVQRNAEYARIKQKFIDQWAVAYNAYGQRTGYPLGDNQQEPRYMVNGANFNVGVAVSGTVSGGDMTGASAPDAICHGAKGPKMSRSFQTGPDFDLRILMQKVGVRMPPGRAEGREDRYVYLDSNGNPQEIQVCFQWNAPGTAAGAGNVMVISGLTPDLARSLDQMVDGKPDAREGLFRQEGVTNASANVAGIEWGVNNTHAHTSANPLDQATTTGEQRDEDQVETVVAIYKMNQ
jgi:prepilin-type N-terminal cleavage/methylation domain-containing protein